MKQEDDLRPYWAICDKKAAENVKKYYLKDNARQRYLALVREFKDNGFTEEQATYLINFLNQFIPMV